MLVLVRLRRHLSSELRARYAADVSQRSLTSPPFLVPEYPAAYLVVTARFGRLGPETLPSVWPLAHRVVAASSRTPEHKVRVQVSRCRVASVMS